MKEAQIEPDIITYSTIVKGYCCEGDVDRALRVLDEMKAGGVVPSNYTLSILVKLLGHARRLSQAFRMVEELSEKHGFRPNVQVYTCLVQACFLNRRLEKA